MLLLRRHAYARAGLVGNPSDGYHGKTISVIIRNFSAQVVLYEWEDVEIVSTEEDQSRFASVPSPPETRHDKPGFRCGKYEPLDPALLPPLYVAYNADISEPTEVFHNDIRGRFNRGEPTVVRAMGKFAALAAHARDALLAH